MSNSFSLALTILRDAMCSVTLLFEQLDCSLKSLDSPSNELIKLRSAFQVQLIYTQHINSLLTTSYSDYNYPEVELKNAISLIQHYFQVTQPLKQILFQILQELPIDNQVEIRNQVEALQKERQKLEKNLDRILQEFSDGIDEQTIQKFIKASEEILGILSSDKPTNKQLSQIFDSLITQLEQAKKFFKEFKPKKKELSSSEADEVQQLIETWEEVISKIEELQQSNGRSEIAKSIKIHDLLEEIYDYLSALVRSSDLESVGIL